MENRRCLNGHLSNSNDPQPSLDWAGDCLLCSAPGSRGSFGACSFAPEENLLVLGRGGIGAVSLSGDCLRLHCVYPYAGRGAKVLPGALLVLEEGVFGKQPAAAERKSAEYDSAVSHGPAPACYVREAASLVEGFSFRSRCLCCDRDMPAGILPRIV